MSAFVRTVRSASRADVDAGTIKLLMIFSGVGMLLSLWSVIAGIEVVAGALF